MYNTPIYNNYREDFYREGHLHYAGFIMTIDKTFYKKYYVFEYNIYI
jgi:hypothetical protein